MLDAATIHLRAFRFPAEVGRRSYTPERLSITAHIQLHLVRIAVTRRLHGLDPLDFPSQLAASPLHAFQIAARD
jgi:hypothetical protein